MRNLLRRVGWRLVPACALAVAAAAVPLFLSCQRPTPPTPLTVELPAVPPWFEDMTDEAGLDFVHDAGPVDDKYFMPQIIGSGAALFDFNNDGLLDILLLTNGGPNGARCRLYQQTPDHRFKDVSAGSGLDIAGYNMGVAVGDVNNDGLPDVVITQYGGIRLFLNDGDGTFADVTEAASLKNTDWGCSAAFFDYDRDGWLDLVVVNYVGYDPAKPCQRPGDPPDYCGPNPIGGRPARLFHNLGPIPGAKGKSVRFEDVTEKSGLGKVPGAGLGVVCADFDGDGWPDILVANDGEANRLWINRQNGTFADEAVDRGVAVNRLGATEANMGIALGDVSGNDMLAVFITHMTSETHTLWVQGPRGRFQDVTSQAGLTRVGWRGTGFGTALCDFDHDGALDIAVVNGRVAKGPKLEGDPLGPHWSLYAERNQVFSGDGQGRFRDLSLHNDPFCGKPNVARGLAYGDVNGDGALDLLVTTVADKARLYRNVAPNRGHWLMVRAVDPKLGGRDAYGAEVRVRAGKRSWLRLINPGSSYLCSNDVRAHFGLGKAERVEEIEVRWPDGTAEVFPACDADRQVVLSRGSGTPHE
jgi:hypothetical protein